MTKFLRFAFVLFMLTVVLALTAGAYTVIDDMEREENAESTWAAATYQSEIARNGNGMMIQHKNEKTLFVQSSRKFKPALDLSAYEGNACISLWVYIEDAEKIPAGIEGQFELASSGASDMNEFGFELSGVTFVSGWNHLVFDITEATLTGAPKIEKINFCRLFLKMAGPNKIVIDDIIIGTTEEFGLQRTDFDISSKAAEGSYKLLESFDKADEFEATEGNTIPEGSLGAAKTTSSGTLAISKVFTESVDLSAFKNGNGLDGGHLRFWMYVNNIEGIDLSQCQVELTSSGESDKDESSVTLDRVFVDRNKEDNIGTLHNGWNLICVPLASMSEGADWTAVNYLRVYLLNGNADNVFMLDDMYIGLGPAFKIIVETDPPPTDPPTEPAVSGDTSEPNESGNEGNDTTKPSDPADPEKSNVVLWVIIGVAAVIIVVVVVIIVSKSKKK